MSKNIKIIDIRKMETATKGGKQKHQLDNFLEDQEGGQEGQTLPQGNPASASTQGNPASASTQGNPASASTQGNEDHEYDEYPEGHEDHEYPEGNEDDEGSDEDSDEGQDGGARKLKQKFLQQARSSTSSSEDGSSSVSSSSTTRMLSCDPLFLVLYQYLVNNKGENIVTVLDKINKNLSKLVQALSVDD
jgi:hypothetical protein